MPPRGGGHHKALDAVGDLAPAGMPIKAAFRVVERLLVRVPAHQRGGLAYVARPIVAPDR